MDDVKKNPFLRYLEYLTGRTQVRLYTVQFGVWSIAIRKEPHSFVPSFPNLKDAKRFIHHLGPAWMFVRDIYRIAPRQFLVYVLHRGWLSIDGGLTLYVSGKLTEAVSAFFHRYQTTPNVTNYFHPDAHFSTRSRGIKWEADWLCSTSSISINRCKASN